MPCAEQSFTKIAKIFSVFAEFVLWELSIVSSLSLYSILVQHARNDLNLETAEFLELGLCDSG